MAVLTLLFAMRVISTGNHMIYVLNPYIDLSLIWILRIEYISVFLMLPIFALLALVNGAKPLNRKSNSIKK